MKLPIWQTVTGAYQTMWQHKLTLLRLALVPLGLFFLLSYAVWALRLGFSPITANVPLLPFVAYFLCCGRLFHLGDPAIGRGWRLPFSSSVLKLLDYFWPSPIDRKALAVLAFFGLFLGTRWALGWLRVLFWVQFSSTSQLPSLLLFAAWEVIELFSVYLVLRFSFAPIAAALDQNWSFSRAWRQTSGNGLRFLAATVLAFLPIKLLSEVVFWTRSYFGPASSIELYWLISGLEGLLSVTVWIAITGIVYRVLADVPDAPEA